MRPGGREGAPGGRGAAGRKGRGRAEWKECRVEGARPGGRGAGRVEGARPGGRGAAGRKGRGRAEGKECRAEGKECRRKHRSCRIVAHICHIGVAKPLHTVAVFTRSRFVLDLEFQIVKNRICVCVRQLKPLCRLATAKASGCSAKALIGNRKFTRTVLLHCNIPKNARFYLFPVKIDNHLLHSGAFYAIMNWKFKTAEVDEWVKSGKAGE